MSINQEQNILKGDLSDLVLELNEIELRSLLKHENDIKKFKSKETDKLNKEYKNLFQYDYIYDYKDGSMNLLNAIVPCSIRSNNKNEINLYVGKEEIIITLCHILDININDVFKETEEDTYQAFINKVKELKNKVIKANTIHDLRDLKIISEDIYNNIIKNKIKINNDKIEFLKSTRKTLLIAIIRDTKELIKRENINITDDVIKYIDIDKLGLWISGNILKDLKNIVTEEKEEFYFNNIGLIEDEEYNKLIKYVIEYYKYVCQDPKYINGYQKHVILTGNSKKDRMSTYTTNDFKKEYAEIYKKYLFESNKKDKEIISKMAENPPEDFFVDWEILPEGNIEHKNSSNKKDYTNKNIDTIGGLKVPKEVIEEQRKQILREKITFFSNTDPILKIKGTNKMDGYYGYIYNNGKVIFEKYYKDSKTQIPATNEAIYIMNIDNFMDLSKLSKPEIIEYIKKDDSKVKRVYHSKKWKEKIIDIINEKTIITKENITEMFDKLSEEKNKEGLKELRNNLIPAANDDIKNNQLIKK